LRERYDQVADFLRFFRDHWKRILFRAHKDRRSLGALLLLLGMIGYCLYDGLLLITHPFSLVMLGLGLFVAWRIRKSHEKDNDTLIRLSNYAPVSAAPAESAIRTLRLETMRLWLLVWRAFSESFLGRQTIPEGKEVRTRRVILDKLEALDLRGELTEGERDLHLLPDGGWSTESITENILRVAELEALQYACGAVRTLSPIEDFDRIQRIETESIRNADSDIAWRPRETFDIRRERDMAATFYLRCFGEQVQRGIVQKDLDEEESKILHEATTNAGNHHTDLLIGTKLISEIENDKLNLAAGQSYLRFKTLQHALSVLEA
jgi:hypothetical protein